MTASTEQRKLAAIMFTDMVGYSALSQRDDKLALELLEEHRDLLRKIFREFNGAEIKTIGDAFLVEFQSALEAAQCAIAIQRALVKHNADAPSDRQIQVKIGIHIGDVVHRGGDVYGDGVNIASRIEPLAPPGGICISEDVERQIRSAGVRVEKLGPSELKNIQTRVELFRVVLEWQDRRSIADSPSKENKRPIKPIAVTAVASLVLLAAASFWFVKRSSTKTTDALRPAYSSTKRPNAIESSTPTESPLESPSPPAVVSLVPEFEEWKKLSLVTWNNSYLMDHAQQRYPEWRRAAESGDAVGQFFVGYCYQHGLTVPESTEQAVEWLAKSAEQGNSDAMLDLAICHGMGIGTQQDVAQYGRWIKAALDDGNTGAMVVHGMGLIAFSPVSSDKAGGKRLVYQAADAGNLDGVYASALLKSQSPTEFNSRLTKAAEGGQPDALYIKAEGFKSSPKGREMVSRALAMMGDPLAVARIIDPNQKLGFNHPNLYPDLAWKRLRQMADEGSAEAARLVKTLQEKGKNR